MKEVLQNLVNGIKGEISFEDTKAELRVLLDTILESPEEYKGTIHPYGFFILKFGILDEDYTLRLHIWDYGPRKRQVPDWAIHRHGGRLYSRIMCGELTNEIHTVMESKPDRQLYFAKYDGEWSVLVKSEIQVSSKLLTRTAYPRGTFYELTREDYHATHVDDAEFSATLVLQEKQFIPPAIVGEINCQSEYRFRREQSTTKHLVQQISKLGERL